MKDFLAHQALEQHFCMNEGLSKLGVSSRPNPPPPKVCRACTYMLLTKPCLQDATILPLDATVTEEHAICWTVCAWKTKR